MSAYDIAGWAEFLAVAAGVAATLTGLIFVAMSINLARILEFPGLPEFAAETIVQLFGAMIISLVALVPGQSSLVVGVELAVAGAILWILQTRLQLRSLKRLRARKDNDQRRPVISIVLAQLAAVPFVLAGITLVLGTLGGLYWLVPRGFFFDDDRRRDRVGFAGRNSALTSPRSPSSPRNCDGRNFLSPPRRSSAASLQSARWGRGRPPDADSRWRIKRSPRPHSL